MFIHPLMILPESVIEKHLTVDETARLADPSMRSDFFEICSQLPTSEYIPSSMDLSLKNTIVVVNLPVVGEDKLGKLSKIVKGLLERFGVPEIEHPIEQGKTLGVAIVTYSKASEAQKALKGADRFKLDDQHVFRVYHIDDVPSFFETSESSADSSDQLSVARFERSDLRDYMTDSQMREQLLVRFQTETQISWFDPLDSSNPLKLEYGGERDKNMGKIWCDGKVCWSPRGSYLATVHSGRGVVLWGGDKFQKKTRFVHASVRDVIFSETEEYIMCVSADSDDSDGIKIFHVLTGDLCRTLPMSILSTADLDSPTFGFSWSSSGKYLAKVVESSLVVYEAPNFKAMVDDSGRLATAKYQGAQMAEFSSKEDWLAIWIPEVANVPGRLVIQDIVTRREIAVKTMFSTVGDKPIGLHWHPSGDFIAIKTHRLVKSQKAGGAKKIAVNVDILALRARNATPFSIDLGADVIVKHVAWEPSSARFAALLENEVNKPGEERKPRLVVWKIGNEKVEELTQLATSQGSFSQISFSPQGQYFVLWDSKTTSGGDMMFCLLPNESKIVEVLRSDNHFLVNGVSWDPSGRYICSSVVQGLYDESAFRYQQEASYTLWSFQGRKIHTFKKEKLYAAVWRPHCESSLTSAEKKKVLGELKLREKQIEEEDDKIRGASKSSVQKAMQAKRDSFNAALAKVDNFFNARS